VQVPKARGPISGWVVDVLTDATRAAPPALTDGDLLTDADTQLALWVSYEMHYRGFEGVHPDAEWDPEVLGLRRRIESRMETQLRAATREAVTGVVTSDIGQALLEMGQDSSGPGIAAYLQRQASADEMRDYLRERSVQQLKESDPHSFVLGRLDGPAKVALAELQYDEYGAGRPERLHSHMYAMALEGAGLDSRYGAYTQTLTGSSLAAANAMSLFAFNRRLLGASMGHLAMFEATSSLPCRKIAAGIERLGFPSVVAAYFEEHVEADAVHEQLAARQICGALVADDPDSRGEILFGAATCMYLDDLVGADLLVRWSSGQRAAS
jgi:hypothetical protein